MNKKPKTLLEELKFVDGGAHESIRTIGGNIAYLSQLISRAQTEIEHLQKENKSLKNDIKNLMDYNS